MKKTIVAIVLASSVAAVAFASLSNRNSSKGSKHAIEKKQEQKEVKKEHKKRCMFG